MGNLSTSTHEDSVEVEVFMGAGWYDDLQAVEWSWSKDQLMLLPVGLRMSQLSVSWDQSFLKVKLSSSSHSEHGLPSFLPTTIRRVKEPPHKSFPLSVARESELRGLSTPREE